MSRFIIYFLCCSLFLPSCGRKGIEVIVRNNSNTEIKNIVIAYGRDLDVYFEENYTGRIQVTIEENGEINRELLAPPKPSIFKLLF